GAGRDRLGPADAAAPAGEAITSGNNVGLDIEWISERFCRGQPAMNETPRRRSAPIPQPARRAVLKLALAVGLTLPVADLVGAQDDRRKARPQTNDRLVFAGGEHDRMPVPLLGVRSQGERAGPEWSGAPTVAGPAAEGRRRRADSGGQFRRAARLRDGRLIRIETVARRSEVDTPRRGRRRRCR